MKHLKIVREILILGMFLSAPAIYAEDMVLIPEGSFKMPALLDKTEQKVSSFYLDSHPVTNADFAAFLKQNPQWQKSKIKRIFSDKNYLEYWRGDLDYGGPLLTQAPVVQVSWYVARAYCDSLGKRLPTLNEWEYVGQLPFRDKKDLKSVILEWYDKSAEWPLPAVKQVHAPNILGVYDMHGLIWEWVEDFNASIMTGESRGDVALDRNLFCGGGAASAADPGDYAAFMRYAFRGSLQAKYTVRNLGFRCAKERK
ncbi:MAG: formylglycine-generating enzyme family protein [Bacillota bacterium]